MMLCSSHYITSDVMNNLYTTLVPCLISSAFGGYLECHRSLSRERPQHHGPQCWALCGSSGNGTVHHFLPAEQTHAHHPPDQRGAVHQLAAQLPAGSLRPVSNPSHDSRLLVVRAFPSEVSAWANAVWNVTDQSWVKIQTIFISIVKTCWCIKLLS